jgi:hypothetical protein
LKSLRDQRRHVLHPLDWIEEKGSPERAPPSSLDSRGVAPGRLVDAVPLRENEIMPLKEIKVSLPFGLGGATWEPNPIEEKAAWKLYIELVTRVATQELSEHEGLDRDVLRSLYSLFGSTRRVLRRAGPTVGIAQGSLGGVAVAVLNKGLRPFLTKWHGHLTVWESSAKPGDEWPKRKEFRSELAALGMDLGRYAEVLAIIAGVEGNQA